MTGGSASGESRRGFLRGAGAVGSAVALGGVGSADTDGVADDRALLVGVTTPTTLDAVADRLPAAVTVRDREETLGFLRVEVAAGSRLGRLRAESAVASTEGVRYVEPDARHHALGDPSDPKFEEQYAPQQVRAPAAWETVEDGERVTVAVVDQGVDYEHPDLREQFDNPVGRDFVDRDDDPAPEDPDMEYHGTHVAGIAAATTNNEEGIAGVSNARLLACRALSQYGSGSTADIARAVRWATDRGAEVINMSLGGGGYSRTMQAAVTYALDNGALPVCAAGNDGSEGVAYPAAYEECVAVSALDEDESLASFSQYGGAVDVAGPGVGVLSTTPDGDYGSLSGTSMACPAAAGVAALAKAAQPWLTAVGLRGVLESAAVDVGLPDGQQGAGRVDAANAVAEARAREPNREPVAAFSTSASVAAVGETVVFDASDARDPDGSVVRHEWALGDGTAADGRRVEHAYDEPGDYAVTLRVVDDDGSATRITGEVGVREDPEESCGADRVAESFEGDLWGSDDAHRYTYAFRTPSPCRVVVSLSGPEYADFDLYLTTDGREPTTADHDRRSATPGSGEAIFLDDLAGHERYGLLVLSRDGGGEYELSVDEYGR